MTTKAITQSDAARRPVPSRALSGFQNLIWWFALAALFAAAVLLRHTVAANTDVSWLLTVGERVLGGQRLYVDVIETNPPMAVLAYMPAIVIARALHVPAEIVVDALVFIGIGISLVLSANILKSSAILDRIRGWPLILIAFAILALLPTETFGQREHIALIALLPALAVYMRRANSETLPAWAMVVAGLGAGLTLTFKPHFAVAIFCGVSALAVITRSWKVFIAPENLIAAVMVGIYALCVVWFTPEFFTTIGPLVRDVYVPVGISWRALAGKDVIPIYLALIATAVFLKRRSNMDAPFIFLLMTSLGFALVFFIQRKGFAYHSYPMIALAVFALGYAIVANPLQNKHDRVFNIGAMALLVLLFSASMLWFNNAFDAKPLEASVARLAAHPKILAITAEPGVGHPLVRSLNGTWVSRQQALWVAAYAKRLRLESRLDARRDAMLAAYEARERAMLIDDIRKNSPDVVLVDNLTGDASAWLQEHPNVMDMLKPYRRVETLNRIDILKRAD